MIGYAQANNVTQIVIGKSARSRWFEILHGSVVHDLVRRSGNISVHVIAGDDDRRRADSEKVGAHRRARRGLRSAPLYCWRWWRSRLALGAAEADQRWLGVENVDLVFLTAIVGVAVRFGLVAVAVRQRRLVAVLQFFLPAADLHLHDRRPGTTSRPSRFFTLVAIIVSNVAARGRTQAMTAQDRARTTESLYSFSRKLAGAGTLDDVLWATAYQTALMLKVRVVLLLPEDGSIAVKAGYPPEDILDDADLAAAKWAWENDRAAGRGSDTLPGAKRLFLPMHTGRGAIGVMGIDSDKPGPLLTPDQRRLLDALADQGALAIERVRLVEDMDRVERAAETERLRSALLTSISHDLKTPLASVLGAAGTLRDLGDRLTTARRPICWRRSSTNPSGSTASSPTSST